MKRALVLILTIAVLTGSIILLGDYPAALVLPEDMKAADFYVQDEDTVIPLGIYFSEDSHFFTSDVTVEIFSTIPDAEIHYTLDGAFPTTNSEIYSEPLTFEPRRGYNAVVLRAIAVYEGEITQPVTHTFFIGDDIDTRFEVMVFSITANPDDLYSYDTGILVSGKTRADYIRENPGINIDPPAPANFNWRGREEGERPVHVEAFLPNGERVLSQLAGVRVIGAWSRAEVVKSLRLIARRDYSPEAGRFHYEFFPDNIIQDGYGLTATAYNSFVLRNGGNDRNHGILRNELGNMLARNAGFLHVTPVRAAAIFINGEYNGYTWLQARFDDRYLQTMYGTPTNEFDVVGRGELWLREATIEQEEDLTFVNNFADYDLTDDAIFAQLESRVDIDNMLWYYAFQIWLANADWPHNNMKRWRYTGEPLPGASPELDGRWRYAIYDLDQTFGLFGQNWRRPTFQIVLERDNENGKLLRAILQRPDMAERFTIIYCDIVANVLNLETVTEVLEELWEQIWPEVERTIDRGLLDGWVSAGSIFGHYGDTLDFAERRHEYIFERLSLFFEFDKEEMFEIHVSGGDAVIGSLQATSSRYFAHLTVPVSPVLPRHTAFGYWVVNGERVNDEIIYITAGNDEIVEIELVTYPNKPPLLIASAYTSANENGIVLTNPTDETVRTEGFYLSNSIQDLQRYSLPGATIAPNATLELAGRSSYGPGDIFRVKLDFNIREGRRVFLSDENGDILDTILLG